MFRNPGEPVSFSDGYGPLITREGHFFVSERGRVAATVFLVVRSAGISESNSVLARLADCAIRLCQLAITTFR
jgi:hypothetical protein